eukprot:876204-Amphidinium_carterae.1
MCPRDSRLLLSCEDAKDYFYLLRAPLARVEETLVGFAVNAQDLSSRARLRGGLLDSHQGRVVLALRAPAMGDKKSVELAQIVHHWSLMRAGALKPASWLSFGYPCPGGRHLCGAYVDDLGVLTIASPSYDHVCGVDSVNEHHDLVRLAREGYENSGIVRKPEKAKEAESESTLWGAEISSKRLELKGDSQKLLVLLEATALLLRQSAARVIEVRRVLGHWTHFCLLARPLLCVMSAVYRWIEGGKGREHLLRPLPAKVRDELWGLMLLHPFMAADLSAT